MGLFSDSTRWRRRCNFERELPRQIAAIVLTGLAMRQQPPGLAAPQRLEDGVDQLARGGATWSSAGAGVGHHLRDSCPLTVREVGQIVGALTGSWHRMSSCERHPMNHAICRAGIPFSNFLSAWWLGGCRNWSAFVSHHQNLDAARTIPGYHFVVLPHPSDHLQIFSGQDGQPTMIRLRDGMPPYARGAAIMAVLATPFSRLGSQQPLLAAWDYWSSQAWSLATPEQWPNGSAGPLARHRLVQDLSKVQLRHVRERPDKALLAAHIAAPFFQKADASNPHFAHTATGTIEGRALAVQAWEELRRVKLSEKGSKTPRRMEPDADNIQTRDLRPFLPLIHVAFATAQAIALSRGVIREMAQENQALFCQDVSGASGRILPQMSFKELLCTDLVQNWIITRAMALETLLPLPVFRRVHSIVQLRADWLNGA